VSPELIVGVANSGLLIWMIAEIRTLREQSQKHEGRIGNLEGRLS